MTLIIQFLGGQLCMIHAVSAQDLLLREVPPVYPSDATPYYIILLFPPMHLALPELSLTMFVYQFISSALSV